MVPYVDSLHVIMTLKLWPIMIWPNDMTITIPWLHEGKQILSNFNPNLAVVKISDIDNSKFIPNSCQVISKSYKRYPKVILIPWALVIHTSFGHTNSGYS